MHISVEQRIKTEILNMSKIDRDSYPFKLAEQQLIGDLNLEGIDFNEFHLRSAAVEYILRQLLLQRTRNMGGYTAVQLSEMQNSTFLGIPALELADSIVTKNRTVVDCDMPLQGLWYNQKIAAEITATAQRYLSLLTDYQKEQITNITLKDQIQQSNKLEQG